MSATATETPVPEKEVGRSDDKCVGNRRIRTIILCLLLFVFSVFACGWLFVFQEIYADTKDSSDFASDAYHAYNIIVSGLVFIMIFSIFTVIFFIVPKCENQPAARFPLGIGLILGSVMYLGGWAYYINTYKDAIYDTLTSSQQEDWDAIFLSWFGEALMYAATTFIIALDISLHLFQQEYNRLAVNFGVLCITSMLVMPAYFILSGDLDGVEAIGTGYIMIMITTAIYIILYIMTCCTCDCKDRPAVRAILCVCLMLSGLVTAVGYYVFAGGNDAIRILGDESDEAKKVSYYFGYTLLVGGLCFIWGIDIAWDDVKERGAVKECCKGC